MTTGPAMERRGMGRYATVLETVSVRVPEVALETYEAALASVCGTVGFFLDEATGEWVVEGVKAQGESDAALDAALAISEAVSGHAATLARTETPADGWLARTYSGFPAQLVGRRFVVRGTHLPHADVPGRINLVLDAGVAFGSGEHGFTRGCLRALERVAHRRPRRILDLGTGSGILAMAAAKLLHRRVLATDIDPWSVRVGAENARLNGLGAVLRLVRSDGWSSPVVRNAAPFDLVFGNILARPLCAMARDLATHLAPGGTAILAGLLDSQVRMVLAAHRRHGLRLEAALSEGRWTTLVLRRAPARSTTT